MSVISSRYAALVVATTALAGAAPASAQSPALEPNTITVTGTGTVRPAPADRNSNASIVAAVEQAERAALPLALDDGRARAARLAQLAGMTLGPLLAIAEPAAAPYGPFGPFAVGPIGTFGPDRFCGTIRTPVYRRTKSGRRKRVGVRSRRVCRVPRQIAASVTMTFRATPAST